MRKPGTDRMADKKAQGHLLCLGASFKAAYFRHTGKIVVGYSQTGLSVRMGSVSGTSISQGSGYSISSGIQRNMSLAYHAASGNMAIFYNTGTGNWNAKAPCDAGNAGVFETGDYANKIYAFSLYYVADTAAAAQRLVLRAAPGGHGG